MLQSGLELAGAMGCFAPRHLMGQVRQGDSGYYNSTNKALSRRANWKLRAPVDLTKSSFQGTTCNLRDWALVSKRGLADNLLLVLHAREVCQCIHARCRRLPVLVRRRCHDGIVGRAQRLGGARRAVGRPRAVCKMAVPRRWDLLVREVHLRRRGDLLAQT